MKDEKSPREESPLKDPFILGFLDKLPIVEFKGPRDALRCFSDEEYGTSKRSLTRRIGKRHSPAEFVDHVMFVRSHQTEHPMVKAALRQVLDHRHVEANRELLRSRMKHNFVLASFGEWFCDFLGKTNLNEFALDEIGPREMELAKKLAKFAVALATSDQMSTTLWTGSDGVSPPRLGSDTEVGTASGRLRDVDSILRVALIRYALGLEGSARVEFGTVDVTFPPVNPPFTDAEAGELAKALGYGAPTTAVGDARKHRDFPLSKLNVRIGLALAVRDALMQGLRTVAALALQDLELLALEELLTHKELILRKEE